ncbi:MAG: hypothetical protein IJW75_01405, partial [Alphaproteobacteria bacterium]|nr:hypothetical protein [Alphaproteobacteria bacterium]
MRICKKILFILIVFSFCIKDVLAYGSKVSLYNFNRLYNLAARGNVTELINIKNNGYNIDVMNYYNDTGLCVAAKKGDVRAFNAFRMAGADIYHRCTRNISNYESFLVSGQKYNARPTYNAATYTQTGASPTYYENGSAYNTANTTYGNSGYRYEGQPAGVEKVSGEENDSTWLWWAAGGAAVIGGVAAAAGGGGGGGSDPCSGVVCGDNQHCQSGSCVCNGGYIDTEGEGVCYPVLECENGVQKGEFCECNEGYVQSADKKSCEVNPCEGYSLTDAPSNATYSDCKSGTTTKYKIDSCNTGYEPNNDRTDCIAATCDGYGLTSCPTGATCSTCQSGDTT